MKLVVDSIEYKCWHEIGHATVCLHLGGDVEFIEFLSSDARGHARTHCIHLPEIERSVACGGFAAEFYLIKSGRAELGPDDRRDISQIIFHNAAVDRQAFWGRPLGGGVEFSKSEDTEFMHYAIGPDGNGGLVPILNRYLPGMQEVVRELIESRRVEGRRIKELLRLNKLR